VAIVELAILSLPEKFISTDDPESMKNNYLSSYKLDKDTEWIILEKENTAIADIPF